MRETTVRFKRALPVWMLLSCIFGLSIIWSGEPERRATLAVQPIYGREGKADYSYRWTPPDTHLLVHVGYDTQRVIIQQRLFAGPTPRDTRPLVIHTGAITTSFAVQGGSPARVYTYLVPMRGQYLYGTYSIAPLDQQGEQRQLGMAISGSRVSALDPPMWPSVCEWGVLLLTLLLPAVTGWRGLIVVGAATAIYFRAPAFVTQPRFWAEEGAVYFRYAYSAPWIYALLTPHNGYFSLFNNIAAMVAADLLPIEYAPQVTTLAAFGVQLVPFVIVLWGRSELWRTNTQKLLTTAILLLAPISAELWLTTICSQFFFSLAALLVLLEESDQAGAARLWYRLLLVLAGLTGPVTCLLTPLFVFKAWIRKNAEYRVQAGIIMACLAIQIVLFWQSTQENVTHRTGDVNLTLITATLWFKTVLVPLLGMERTDALGETFKHWWSAHPTLALTSGYVAALALVALFWVVSRRLTWELRMLMIGSYMCIAVPSIITSLKQNKTDLIGGVDSYRYFYVPTIILLLLLAQHISFGRARELFVTAGPMLCTLLLAVVLIGSGVRYRGVMRNAMDWPQWEREVSRWRVEPSYKPAIVPPGWTIELSHQVH